MKIKLLYCLLIAMSFGLLNANSQTVEDFISEQKPIKIGDEISMRVKTSHPYQTLKAGVAFEKEFESKNSTYIKIYFRNFDLAPGDYVEIYSPKTKESLIYAGKGKIVDNGEVTISDFWSQVIFSDKVIVKLHTVQASKGYGFDIETVAYGYSPERIVELQELQGQAAICGSDDKERIACYSGTEMFNKAKAVCKLILNGSGACTGWLLGCEGNVMTNNHCIGNASTARNTDFLFNFQANNCSGGGNATTDQVASSATLIKTSGAVDATFVKLPVNPTDKYGYLSLRSEAARTGERIYIPQHPGGRRKEIAVKEENGFGRIARTNGRRDVEYNTDTEGGSSGSPVLDFRTNLVVSIHNTGGCPNGSTGGNTRLIAWLGSDMPECGLDDDNTGAKLPVSGFDVAVNCTEAVFTSTSQNATSYLWEFGDGNTSTQENPTHTYGDAGQYNVKLTVTNTVGSNDKRTSITTQKAVVPNAIQETVCTGESATITLPDDKGYIWYDQASGGNIIGAGTTFETGALTEDKEYFVSGTSEKILTGNLGAEIDMSSGDNHQGGFYLVFDAADSFILSKAKVFAEGAGNRTLELRDASGTLITSKVINIPNGEQVIDINLKIAAGNNLQIGFANGANLFRSNANLRFPYKYNASNRDLVSIKESTASVPTGFYYYLYNWEVSVVGSCETDDRGKVTVKVETLATPTLTADQNTGVMTVNQTFASYQWFFNGTAINGATSNTYTATQNGKYTVEVSNGSCEALSEEVEFSTLSNSSFELPLGVAIYPNPTNDVLNIKGLNTLESVKQLKVINMLGQTVKHYQLNTVSETTTLNVQELSNGLYFLNIDDKYTAKFVVK